MNLDVIWALAFIISAVTVIVTLVQRLVQLNVQAHTEKAGSFFLFLYGAGAGFLDGSTAGYIAAAVGMLWFLFAVFSARPVERNRPTITQS